MKKYRRRGVLTKEVSKIARKMIGKKITLRELRLIPYIHYIMCNEQKIDPIKINQNDRNILSKWRKEGHIKGGIRGLSITKEFWDFMCEILFEAYVKGGTE